jgi:hypothetical protein
MMLNRDTCPSDQQGCGYPFFAIVCILQRPGSIMAGEKDIAGSG